MKLLAVILTLGAFWACVSVAVAFLAGRAWRHLQPQPRPPLPPPAPADVDEFLRRVEEHIRREEEGRP